MKKALLAAGVCILSCLVAIIMKVRPSDVLTTMIAYWVLLDRLEKEDEE